MNVTWACQPDYFGKDLYSSKPSKKNNNSALLSRSVVKVISG